MKIGILGLGSIGRKHFSNFQNLGCEVIGYDPEFSAYKDYNEVLGCDGLVIASPSKMHYCHILEGTGVKKPMLVEKPLVMTHEQSEKVPLTYIRMVGYNLRFRPCVQKARAWIGAGKIGHPQWARFICAQYNDRPAYRRDGVILNWSHEIDLAFHLLGEGSVMTAFHSNDETIADLIIAHVNNRCLTTVHLDYITRPEDRGFTIAGEDGTINVGTLENHAYLMDNQGTLRDTSRGNSSYEEDYINEAIAFKQIVEHGIAPDDTPEFCTAKQGQLVVEACLDAKYFGASGGR
jgi:predicted dehydrogenase